MILVGCDVHARKQSVAVMDTDTGGLTELQLDHGGDAVERFYGALPPPAVVAIEASGHARWFQETLQRLGHTLMVGDPVRIRLMADRRTKTDRRDARHLLDLLLHDRFPAVWVPDPEVRDLRALIGHRMRLMKMRKGILLGLHAVALNARLPGRSARLTIGRIHQLKGLVLGPHTGRWRDDGLQLAELLGNKIRMLDGVIADAAKGDHAACRLMTHPGVGPLTALITVLTLGPVQRFGGAKAVVSYAGLAPSVKASADRYRMGPISKRGNALLRFTLVQAAVSSVKYEPALRQVYLALSRRRGHAKAKIGAARRLLIRLYIMLRDEIDYQEFTRRGHQQGPDQPSAVIR